MMSPKKRWWVKKIGKGWWIGHEHFALGNFFSTWERAYAEAVRRTRTVEVELPPIAVAPIGTSYGSIIHKAGSIPLSTPSPGLWGQSLEAEQKDGFTIRLRGPYGDIYWCSWDDVKTTALHLLALHYHHERNQK